MKTELNSSNKLFLSTCLVAASLVLAGCASDDYAIEKRYWQTQKEAEKIFKNPHGSPPQELQKVVNKLHDFAQKYPKTNLSVSADFSVARLYMVKEEYANARTELKKLADKYRKSKDISSEVVFLIGNSYELQDKWESALQQYRKLMQEYPLTPRGIDIPVYIAQHYKVKYQPEKMISAFRQAIEHYKSLSAKYSGTPLAYNVDVIAARCYAAIKDWQGSIDTLNAIMERYVGKINMEGLLLEVAFIYNKELNDKVKAKEMLERFIKDYPRSKLINVATKALKELDKK